MVTFHEMCNLCLSPSTSRNVYQRAEKFVLQRWSILHTSSDRAFFYMSIDILDTSQKILDESFLSPFPSSLQILEF